MFSLDSNVSLCSIRIDSKLGRLLIKYSTDQFAFNKTALQMQSNIAGLIMLSVSLIMDYLHPILANVTDFDVTDLSSVTYNRTGINEMWILKNSSEFHQKMNSFYYLKTTSIQTVEFSTLYTSIRHQKLKDRIHMLVNQTFLYKNGSRRYKYLVLNGTFFINEETSAGKKYDETPTC